MSTAYFDTLITLLRVIIFVSFILVFLYIVYCEGKEAVKSERSSS